MVFALLADPEDPDSEKVAPDAEDVGEFQEGGIYQDREGIFLEEAGKSHDGLALFANFCGA